MNDIILSKSNLIKWGIFIGLSTLIGLLNFAVIINNAMADQESIQYIYPLIYEMTGAYSFLILLPLPLGFFKRFPFRKNNWPYYVPFYFAVSIIFGFSHTMLMWFSRIIIFKLAGLGSYDYGLIGYRIVMEYGKQFINFCVLFGLYSLHRYIQENQRQKLKSSELEQQLINARLRALQMKLNPHFLFNTLNMISATMYEDVKKADKMIANLSELLRFTLKATDSTENTLKKEFDHLRLYIDIMKARFQEKLMVDVEVDVETAHALIPAFILQPLVENSIKHGMAETTSLFKIFIKSTKENNRLILLVKDNGNGISEDLEDFSNRGYGLSTTQERLEKMYGKNHSFDLLNLETGGLLVKVQLPFKLANKE